MYQPEVKRPANFLRDEEVSSPRGGGRGAVRWRDWGPEANPGTVQFPPPLAAAPVNEDTEAAHRARS